MSFQGYTRLELIGEPTAIDALRQQYFFRFRDIGSWQDDHPSRTLVALTDADLEVYGNEERLIFMPPPPKVSAFRFEVIEQERLAPDHYYAMVIGFKAGAYMDFAAIAPEFPQLLFCMSYWWSHNPLSAGMTFVTIEGDKVVVPAFDYLNTGEVRAYGNNRYQAFLDGVLRASTEDERRKDDEAVDAWISGEIGDYAAEEAGRAAEGVADYLTDLIDGPQEMLDEFKATDEQQPGDLDGTLPPKGEAQ